MNLVFLGGFFPEQYSYSIMEKSRLQVQNAANNFQWAFIKGLEQNLQKPIKLLTAPYIGWFPKYYKDLIVSKVYFSYKNEANSGTMVGFINLPFIKNIFKFLNLRSALKQLIEGKNKNVIIVYSYDWAYLKAALSAKRKNPDTIVCVIITDCYDWKERKGFMYRLSLKKLFNVIQLKLLHKADCYVVLTDQMVEYLGLNNKPWVRVEGIYNEDETFLNQFMRNKSSDQEKVILYTGTLEYPYGIKELLDAFRLIREKDYRLWICGSGSGKNLVQRRAQEDDRITYFGIVGKEKIIELQTKATILVNPRNTIGEYNKYSFPSKTMEYFASGTPALIYRLDGIPDEYFNYCYTVPDNSISALSMSMIETCQLDKIILKIKGQNARNFILENKNAKAQCYKVIDLFKNRFKFQNEIKNN